MSREPDLKALTASIQYLIRTGEQLLASLPVEVKDTDNVHAFDEALGGLVLELDTLTASPTGAALLPGNDDQPIRLPMPPSPCPACGSLIQITVELRRTGPGDGKHVAFHVEPSTP
jgi:hypothetical protein